MRREAGGACVLDLSVPSKLLPLTLGSVLFHPAGGAFDGPAAPAATHFAVPLGMLPGSALELGASLVSASKEGACDVNFAVFSGTATSMSLCLLRRAPDGAPAGEPAAGFLEVGLDTVTNRTGDVWHVTLQGLKDVGSLCWGWRANGAIEWGQGGRFHPGYLLLDPYARLAAPVMLPPAAYANAPLLPPGGALTQPVMLGSLAPFTHVRLSQCAL